MSVFNTYLYGGLPPGPICNPGEAALKAAVTPAKSDFLYFVADRTGGHTFSQTFEEHLDAIAAARRRARHAAGGVRAAARGSRRRSDAGHPGHAGPLAALSRLGARAPQSNLEPAGCRHEEIASPLRGYLLTAALGEDALGRSFAPAASARPRLRAPADPRLTRALERALLDAIEENGEIHGFLKNPAIARGVDMDAVDGVPYLAWNEANGRTLDRPPPQVPGSRPPRPDRARAPDRRKDRDGPRPRLQHDHRRGPHASRARMAGIRRDLGRRRDPPRRIRARRRSSSRDRAAAVRGGGWPYLDQRNVAAERSAENSDVYLRGRHAARAPHGSPAAPGSARAREGHRSGRTAAAAAGDPRRPADDPGAGRDVAIKSSGDLRRELGKLLFSGPYSPSTFNLAYFLNDQFREEIETEARARKREAALDTGRPGRAQPRSRATPAGSRARNPSAAFPARAPGAFRLGTAPRGRRCTAPDAGAARRRDSCGDRRRGRNLRRLEALSRFRRRAPRGWRSDARTDADPAPRAPADSVRSDHRHDRRTVSRRSHAPRGPRDGPARGGDAKPQRRHAGAADRGAGGPPDRGRPHRGRSDRSPDADFAALRIRSHRRSPGRSPGPSRRRGRSSNGPPDSDSRAGEAGARRDDAGG